MTVEGPDATVSVESTTASILGRAALSIGLAAGGSTGRVYWSLARKASPSGGRWRNPSNNYGGCQCPLYCNGCVTISTHYHPASDCRDSWPTRRKSWKCLKICDSMGPCTCKNCWNCLWGHSRLTSSGLAYIPDLLDSMAKGEIGKEPSIKDFGKAALDPVSWPNTSKIKTITPSKVLIWSVLAPKHSRKFDK